jgi:hypothetical protein
MSLRIGADATRPLCWANWHSLPSLRSCPAGATHQGIVLLSRLGAGPVPSGAKHVHQSFAMRPVRRHARRHQAPVCAALDHQDGQCGRRPTLLGRNGGRHVRLGGHRTGHSSSHRLSLARTTTKSLMLDCQDNQQDNQPVVRKNSFTFRKRILAAGSTS